MVPEVIVKNLSEHCCAEVVALIVCVVAFICVLILDREHVNALVALLGTVIPILWRAASKKISATRSEENKEDGK